jgi:hypothetical protein
VVPLILQSVGGIDQWRRRVLRLHTNMISIACPSACNWTPIDTGTAREGAVEHVRRGRTVRACNRINCPIRCRPLRCLPPRGHARPAGPIGAIARDEARSATGTYSVCNFSDLKNSGTKPVSPQSDRCPC